MFHFLVSPFGLFLSVTLLCLLSSFFSFLVVSFHALIFFSFLSNFLNFCLSSVCPTASLPFFLLSLCFYVSLFLLCFYPFTSSLLPFPFFSFSFPSFLFPCGFFFLVCLQLSFLFPFFHCFPSLLFNLHLLYSVLLPPPTHVLSLRPDNVQRKTPSIIKTMCARSRDTLSSFMRLINCPLHHAVRAISLALFLSLVHHCADIMGGGAGR